MNAPIPSVAGGDPTGDGVTSRPGPTFGTNDHIVGSVAPNYPTVRILGPIAYMTAIEIAELAFAHAAHLRRTAPARHTAYMLAPQPGRLVAAMGPRDSGIGIDRVGVLVTAYSYREPRRTPFGGHWYQTVYFIETLDGRLCPVWDTPIVQFPQGDEFMSSIMGKDWYTQWTD